MASIRHSLRISAPISDVFGAISTDEGVKSWFTPSMEGSLQGGQIATCRWPA
jgi:uncharacterized protein YndB with AHSA1/START domain